MIKILSAAQEMESLGADLLASLKGGNWVALSGDLGTGKTTLVRGALRSAGFNGPVKSPTFTLVESYDFNNIQLYHFDFYRINDYEELEFMGLRDYFNASSICFVEWPDVARPLLPKANVEVSLTHAGSSRKAEIEFKSDRK